MKKSTDEALALISERLEIKNNKNFVKDTNIEAVFVAMLAEQFSIQTIQQGLGITAEDIRACLAAKILRK